MNECSPRTFLCRRGKLCGNCVWTQSVFDKSAALKTRRLENALVQKGPKKIIYSLGLVDIDPIFNCFHKPSSRSQTNSHRKFRHF